MVAGAVCFLRGRRARRTPSAALAAASPRWAGARLGRAVATLAPPGNYAPVTVDVSRLRPTSARRAARRWTAPWAIAWMACVATVHAPVFAKRATRLNKLAAARLTWGEASAMQRILAELAWHGANACSRAALPAPRERSAPGAFASRLSTRASWSAALEHVTTRQKPATHSENARPCHALTEHNASLTLNAPRAIAIAHGAARLTA